MLTPDNPHFKRAKMLSTSRLLRLQFHLSLGRTATEFFANPIEKEASDRINQLWRQGETVN